MYGRDPERCYCGDTECSRCYPGRSRRRVQEDDGDAAYDRWVDEQMEKKEEGKE
jgi:hypothetical protein